MLTAKLNLLPHLALQIFLLYLASVCEACNQLDQEALLSLHFNTTSSPPLNWSSSIDCCLWEGIKCDVNNRVTHLWLPRRAVSGKMSSYIGNLTHLSHLNLSHNSLSGSLPFLTQLETLDLSYNYLSGEFPSSLSSRFIKFVDLSSNHFNGTIPSSFFQLAENLMSFNVSNNSFTGAIPSSAWTNSSCSVTLLDFSYNDFSGQVPPGLGNCSKLQTFRAGFNNISGLLPDDIYSATSLEELSLPVNHLSGSVRNTILQLKNLTVLELYGNQFTGLIPQDIGKLTNLEHLILHDNNLSGSLPPSMENCINLITLNLRINNFEGDLSVFNFSMLLHLRTLDLGYNNFTGSFPSTFNSCKLLMAIRLTGNHLVGNISPNIVALESLSYLSLSGNNLSNIAGAMKILMGCKNLSVLILTKAFMYEPMPDNDQLTASDGFQNLQVLCLRGNQLSGQLPSWISKLRKLQILNLSENLITGSIPGWLGNFPNLFRIHLGHNLFSGEFPKELGGLAALASKQAYHRIDKGNLELPIFILPTNNVPCQQYNKLSNMPPQIILRNNNLSGNIPTEVGQLKALHVLDLSHNNFSGNIPNQISQLKDLESLELSGNHLSGEIPDSLRDLHFLSSFNVSDNNLQGPIPSGGQFDTFSSSSFDGNPGLCGSIVQRSCSRQRSTPSLSVPGEPSSQELHFGLIAGGTFGFIIGCTSGIIVPLCRLKFLLYSTLWQSPFCIRRRGN